MINFGISYYKVVQRFTEHIASNLSFLTGKKILIACSGGLDSVVLAYLFRELNVKMGLAHCNFSLRDKESDGDEEFVVNLADKLSVPVFTETFNTLQYAEDQRISTQMAARELRYRWFEEILTTFQYDYIVTAHHTDDALETFLINLSRGTGLRGLKGIPEVNGTIVRPLLPFSREEIEEYAVQNKFKWREDSSNAETKYLRNKIRHTLVPILKELSGDFLTNFQKTESYLADSQSLIDDYMSLIYNLVIEKNNEGYSINIQKLKELPNTIALLYELLQPFNFTSFKDIYNLLDAQSGKQVFSATHRLLKNREHLLLTEIPSEKNNKEIQITKDTKAISKPIKLSFETVQKLSKTDKNIAYLAQEKLKYPLLLRKWNKGDVFQPFGMQGKKKLSKFFKDEKLSLIAKEKIWVLCSGKTIVWVVGNRLDDSFKISEKTEHILKISYTP